MRRRHCDDRPGEHEATAACRQAIDIATTQGAKMLVRRAEETLAGLG